MENNETVEIPTTAPTNLKPRKVSQQGTHQTFSNVPPASGRTRKRIFSNPCQIATKIWTTRILRNHYQAWIDSSPTAA